MRHLHALLAEWELSTLSADHTSRLLAMLGALRARLGASAAKLTLWHDGIHVGLGPERTQSLFWDLLDPTAAECLSPHAYQRGALAAIERRCAQVRVRSAHLTAHAAAADAAAAAAAVGSGGLPRAADVVLGRARLAESSDASSGLGRAPRAVRSGAAGGDGEVGVRIVRCPHACVSWEMTASTMAAMDAARQLTLARHAPAFLGHEPCVPADARSGYPAHARWYLEQVEGDALNDALAVGGPLAESSLLFRYWRRELLEALLEISTHTSFLLRQPVSLAHVTVGADGCRVVLDGLQWGAEFPEREEGAHATPSAVATGADAAGGAGGDAAEAGESGGAGGAGRVGGAGGGGGGGGTLSDHQALRDTLLLYDGLRMLDALLGGRGAAKSRAPAPPPPSAPPSPYKRRLAPSVADAPPSADGDPPFDGAPGGPPRSAYLRAVFDACAHPTAPPTLRQLLSHPYFAPVDAFERDDVRAAYRRWTRRAP